MKDIQLSVILVTSGSYRYLRKTIRHLAAQAIADQIQLILVFPGAPSVGIPSEDVQGLGEVTTIDSGAVGSTAGPRVQGVEAANGEVTAFAEDHCFPQPGWAQAIVEAHSTGHAAVGPSVGNANPRTLISWAEIILNFGPNINQPSSKESALLCWHNTSYKTQLLRNQKDLPQMLEVEGVFFRRLARDGQTLYRAADARVVHTNASKFRSFVLSQFWGTRLFWSVLASVEGWHWHRRLLFVVASPALAARRFLRGYRDLRRITPERTLSVIPHLAIGSLVLSLGAVIGLLCGPGNSMRYRLSLEYQRDLHLCKGEEEVIFV